MIATALEHLADTEPCSADTPLARWANPEAHYGHVELARVAALVILCAKCRDAIQRQTPHSPRTGGRSARGEPVDAGRNRGVSREDGARAAAFSNAVSKSSPLLREFGMRSNPRTRRAPRWCGTPLAAGRR